MSVRSGDEDRIRTVTAREDTGGEYAQNEFTELDKHFITPSI